MTESKFPFPESFLPDTFTFTFTLPTLSLRKPDDLLAPPDQLIDLLRVIPVANVNPQTLSAAQPNVVEVIMLAVLIVFPLGRTTNTQDYWEQIIRDAGSCGLDCRPAGLPLVRVVTLSATPHEPLTPTPYYP